jgi:hypothetical protein
MYAYEFGDIVEGCIQYFAGGLILAVGMIISIDILYLSIYLYLALTHTLSPSLSVCLTSPHLPH